MIVEEKRVCQNCHGEFTIDASDFAFYEKIEVSPPTFCPECRLIRRLLFHNVFSLYKRKCDFCGKEVISRYSPDKAFRVYCPHCWWSNKWDPLEYGKEYDFSRPFFEQFRELLHKVPLLGLSVTLETADDSPYTNDAGHLKQCYLLFGSDFNERCLYGYYVARSYDCIDSSFIQSCELSYDLFHCYKNYRGINLAYTLSTSDSAFLWQCTNCQSCFLSANLRNKRYYIFNKPYSKKEYVKKIQEYDLGSYRNYTRLKEEARKHWLKYPVKTFWQEFSRDVSGVFVFSSKNCKQCFEVYGVQDCRFVSFLQTPPVKDSYDYTWWGNNASLVYESVTTGTDVSNIKFADESGIRLYDAQYVKLCLSASSHIFGCIGVRKGSYCILNKQYSKEEYEKLVGKIIKHMNDMPYQDKKGRMYRYGEFFPPELSSFAHNETLAQLCYPLTKKEALEKGYTWQDRVLNEHEITIYARDLPDHIQDVKDSILKETIGCASCDKAFRLIPQELTFYRKMNLPLPRQCFFCRLREKLKDQPKPLGLWKRQCQCNGKGNENGFYENTTTHVHSKSNCANEVETGYAPERPEIIYCKECYEAEVV